MTNWVAKLTGETRSQLLALLRRSARSIRELAEELGVSTNAVRMHVAALERDGLVEPAGVERATGGKPAQLYQMTRAAEELHPKGYAVVLNGLLQMLEEREGRERVQALLRELGARTAGGLAEGEPGVRVEEAAEALRALGGEVEVVKSEGEWRIQGYACPLAAVVEEHEEACALAEALVAGVTGLRVEECCEHGSHPRCAFRVERPGE
ncbi:MAG TPA: ArsR family transcriptional regulator [Longimicrobiaceae bacterium]|nr:ArsR family transcriptional regulator [Longimicrobiaceae bacterium]